MGYEIVYTKRAAKDIAKLDHKIRRQIKGSLEKYKESPLGYARKMVDPAFGSYRFRIGDYRVIFDIEENKIVILRVGHRKEIYKG